LPGRATKTAKSSKKAAPKPRGKAKRAPAKKPKKEPAEENIVQGAATPVEATPEQVAPVVSSEALYHGGPRQEELHLVEPIQREAHVTAPPQPLIAPAPEAEAIALPPSAPQVALPLEHPSSEREEERPEEPSVAEALPPRQNVPPNHVFIGKAPIMGYALSAVMQLTQYPNVVLRARGKAIARAVDVAEVIIRRLGSGQFVVRSIKIDTEVVGEGPDRRNISTIEISVGKKE
jgi:DNA-binding protein